MQSSLRLVLAWAPLWGLWFLIAISSPGQSLAHATLDAIPVPVEKILQCEARGDYVALHTADGCYVVNTSVEYLAERLSPESFVRIHRSRIVNLEAVQAFERHDDKRVRARLTNGTTVVASRAWSSALRDEAT